MISPKKVLLVYYSQTGQLADMAHHLVEPLRDDPMISLDICVLEPETPFTFPWKFFDFFNAFPESVAGLPSPIKPPDIACAQYDLVILGYTVWFLSPAQPIAAFLQREETRALLKDTPVITLIGCRNMWLMAQEKVKAYLQTSGAKLIGNIVKIDSCGGPLSFIATPLWMLSGRKQLASFLPVAGIDAEERKSCDVFGEKIKEALNKNVLNDRILAQMGAVHVNERLILSEQFALRSFTIWGKGIRKAGTYSKYLRAGLIIIYVFFLAMIILTVVPISALIKRLCAPLLKSKIQKQKTYFSWPSGE